MNLSGRAILFPLGLLLDRGQHADAPLELSVGFTTFVLVQHALKGKAQVCRIDRHRLVKAVANEFSVADIVSPGLGPLGRAPGSAGSTLLSPPDLAAVGPILLC